MTSMMMTTVGSKLPVQRNQSPFRQVMMQISRTSESATFCNASERQRLTLSYGKNFKHLPWSTFAVGKGLEASIADQSKNEIRLDNVKIVIESRDNDKINLRVDLTGEETQKAFDRALTIMASTAPPIPGFRRMKGGAEELSVTDAWGRPCY